MQDRCGLERIGHQKQGGTVQNSFGTSPGVVVLAEHNMKGMHNGCFGKGIGPIQDDALSDLAKTRRRLLR